MIPEQVHFSWHRSPRASTYCGIPFQPRPGGEQGPAVASDPDWYVRCDRKRCCDVCVALRSLVMLLLAQERAVKMARVEHAWERMNSVFRALLDKHGVPQPTDAELSRVVVRPRRLRKLGREARQRARAGGGA